MVAEAGLPPTLSFIPLTSHDVVLSVTSNSNHIYFVLNPYWTWQVLLPSNSSNEGKRLSVQLCKETSGWWGLDQRLWKAESVEFTLQWSITSSQANSTSPEKPLNTLLRRLWDCKGEALKMELLLLAHSGSPQWANSLPQEYLCEIATAFRIG